MKQLYKFNYVINLLNIFIIFLNYTIEYKILEK